MSWVKKKGRSHAIQSYKLTRARLEISASLLIADILAQVDVGKLGKITLYATLVEVYAEIENLRTPAANAIRREIRKVILSHFDNTVVHEALASYSVPQLESLPAAARIRKQTEPYPKIYVAFYASFIELISSLAADQQFEQDRIMDYYWEHVSVYLKYYLPPNTHNNISSINWILRATGVIEEDAEISDDVVLSLKYFQLIDTVILNLEESLRLMLINQPISEIELETAMYRFRLIQQLLKERAKMSIQELDEGETYLQELEELDVDYDEELVYLISFFEKGDIAKVLEQINGGDESKRAMLAGLRDIISVCTNDTWTETGPATSQYLGVQLLSATEIVESLSIDYAHLLDSRDFKIWGAQTRLNIFTRLLQEELNNGSALALVSFVLNVTRSNYIDQLQRGPESWFGAFYATKLKPILADYLQLSSDCDESELLTTLISRVYELQGQDIGLLIQSLAGLKKLFIEVEINLSEILRALNLEVGRATVNEDTRVTLPDFIKLFNSNQVYKPVSLPVTST